MTRKSLSLLLTVIFVLSNGIFVHSAESNFWSERRRSQNVQLASVPAALQGSQDSKQIINQFPQVRRSLDSVSKESRAGIQSNLPSNARPYIENLPLNFGSVRAVHLPEKKQQNSAQPFVVLIQDVHRNTEAQANIAGLIEFVAETAKENKSKIMVGVEGAFDRFDFSDFWAFNDAVALKGLADYLLERHLIAAPSYAGLTLADQSHIQFQGIDDKSHYDENADAVREAAPGKDRALSDIEKELQGLIEKKKDGLNSDLRRFDSLQSEFQNGSLGLGEYLSQLAHLQKTFQSEESDTAMDFVMEQFLAAYKMEKSLDFDRVEHERVRVIEKLAQKLTADELTKLATLGLAYKTGRIGFADYYRAIVSLLQTHNISRHDYPLFDRYIQYVLLVDGIKAEELIAAQKRLEKNLLTLLIRNDLEKQLMEDSRRLYLSKNLVNFALTPDEWEEYVALKNQLIESLKEVPSPARGRARVGVNPPLAPPFAGRGTEIFGVFEEFYKQADIRSEKMVENVLKNSNGTSVMVAGGFHTDEMARLLKERGVGFAVVQPKITKIDGLSGTEYLSIFTREKSTLDQMFTGEKLFLAPKGANLGSEAGVSVSRFGKTALVGRDLSENKPMPDLKSAYIRVNGESADIAFDGDGVVVRVEKGTAGSEEMALDIPGVVENYKAVRIDDNRSTWSNRIKALFKSRLFYVFLAVVGVMVIIAVVTFDTSIFNSWDSFFDYIKTIFAGGGTAASTGYIPKFNLDPSELNLERQLKVDLKIELEKTGLTFPGLSEQEESNPAKREASKQKQYEDLLDQVDSKLLFKRIDEFWEGFYYSLLDTTIQKTFDERLVDYRKKFIAAYDTSKGWNAAAQKTLRDEVKSSPFLQDFNSDHGVLGIKTFIGILYSVSNVRTFDPKDDAQIQELRRALYGKTQSLTSRKSLRIEAVEKKREMMLPSDPNPDETITLPLYPDYFDWLMGFQDGKKWLNGLFDKKTVHSNTSRYLQIRNLLDSQLKMLGLDGLLSLERKDLKDTQKFIVESWPDYEAATKAGLSDEEIKFGFKLRQYFFSIKNVASLSELKGAGDDASYVFRQKDQVSKSAEEIKKSMVTLYDRIYHAQGGRNRSYTGPSLPHSLDKYEQHSDEDDEIISLADIKSAKRPTVGAAASAVVDEIDAVDVVWNDPKKSGTKLMSQLATQLQVDSSGAAEFKEIVDLAKKLGLNQQQFVDLFKVVYDPADTVGVANLLNYLIKVNDLVDINSSPGNERDTNPVMLWFEKNGNESVTLLKSYFKKGFSNTSFRKDLIQLVDANWQEKGTDIELIQLQRKMWDITLTKEDFAALRKNTNTTNKESFEKTIQLYSTEIKPIFTLLSQVLPSGWPAVSGTLITEWMGGKFKSPIDAVERYKELREKEIGDRAKDLLSLNNKVRFYSRNDAFEFLMMLYVVRGKNDSDLKATNLKETFHDTKATFRELEQKLSATSGYQDRFTAVKKILPDSSPFRGNVPLTSEPTIRFVIRLFARINNMFGTRYQPSARVIKLFAGLEILKMTFRPSAWDRDHNNNQKAERRQVLTLTQSGMLLTGLSVGLAAQGGLLMMFGGVVATLGGLLMILMVRGYQGPAQRDIRRASFQSVAIALAVGGLSLGLIAVLPASPFVVGAVNLFAAVAAQVAIHLNWNLRFAANDFITLLEVELMMAATQEKLGKQAELFNVLQPKIQALRVDGRSITAESLIGVAGLDLQNSDRLLDVLPVLNTMLANAGKLRSADRLQVAPVEAHVISADNLEAKAQALKTKIGTNAAVIIVTGDTTETDLATLGNDKIQFVTPAQAAALELNKTYFDGLAGPVGLTLFVSRDADLEGDASLLPLLARIESSYLDVNARFDMYLSWEEQNLLLPISTQGLMQMLEFKARLRRLIATQA